MYDFYKICICKKSNFFKVKSMFLQCQWSLQNKMVQEQLLESDVKQNTSMLQQINKISFYTRGKSMRVIAVH